MPIRSSGSTPSDSSPAASASTRSAACFQVTEDQSPFSGMRKASLSPDFSTRCRNNCAKLSARSGLALVLAIGLPFALSDIALAMHADPLRRAPLRLRSSWTYSCRPAAPSFAALAIVMDLFMPTRCAQLRCACDRHGPIHADPLRCACDRHGLILLGVPTAVWPKREFAVRLGVSRGFRQFGLHHSRGFG